MFSEEEAGIHSKYIPMLSHKNVMCVTISCGGKSYVVRIVLCTYTQNVLEWLAFHVMDIVRDHLVKKKDDTNNNM